MIFLSRRFIWLFILAEFIGFVFFCPEKKLFAQKVETKREISFSWEPLSGAKGYELEFSSVTKDKKLLSKKPVIILTDSIWKGTLTPGYYQFRIRALDKMQIPGPWSDQTDLFVKVPIPKLISPTQNEIIKSKEKDEDEISFEWEALDASRYSLEFIDSKNKIIVQELKSDKAKIKLSVAEEYRWRVQAFDNSGEKGDEAKDYFSFKIFGKQIDKPTVKNKAVEKITQIEWEKPDFTESYSIKIFKLVKKTKSKNATWKLQFKEKKYAQEIFEIPEDWKEGKYRIEITAMARLREKSETEKFEFNYAPPKKEISSFEKLFYLKGALGYSYWSSKLTRNNILQFQTSPLFAYYYSVSGDFWLPFYNKLGAHGEFSRMNGELFTEYTGKKYDEKPLKFAVDSSAVNFKYRLGWGNFQADFKLGLANRTAVLFVYSKQDSNVEVVSTRVMAHNLGFGLSLNLEPLVLINGSFEYLRFIESNKISLEGSGSGGSLFNITFSKNIFFERLFIEIPLAFENQKFIFKYPENQTSTLEMSYFRFGIGGAFRY